MVSMISCNTKNPKSYSDKLWTPEIKISIDQGEGFINHLFEFSIKSPVDSAEYLIFNVIGYHKNMLVGFKIKLLKSDKSNYRIKKGFIFESIGDPTTNFLALINETSPQDLGNLNGSSQTLFYKFVRSNAERRYIVFITDDWTEGDFSIVINSGLLTVIV